MSQILRAQSTAIAPYTAVEELKNSLNPASSSLILFFCSSSYDLNMIAEGFNHFFPDTEVVGCTSAGEIGPTGYVDHSISAISFPRDDFHVVTACLNDLSHFTESQGKQFIQSIMVKPESSLPAPNHRYTFAMQLIDGLSKKEENVSHCFQKYLSTIPLFGGSAADDVQFTHTYIFHQGRFQENSCVLMLFRTNRPFRMFKTQHFTAAGEPLVVTETDTNNRIIRELNGLPATQVYAQQVGCSVEQLDAKIFANYPVIMKINGNEYIRSIQKANADGSLSLYCAIEEGIVLRIAHSQNLERNLSHQFETLNEAIGGISLTLVCDCILRRTEILNTQQLPDVTKLLLQNQTSGFSSFGEQFGSLHLNQTCTGIAFGCEEAE
ncbi:FIST N-terminal domain-containing protein [Tolumonas lignilytica]|uniref:FIST N-terminal domain-containing protein n=1 Tax=Tolumonas lignilytica TaxID=1283284 RepID=UPI000467E146|nr:FIST N-terminal domain-containing protein [Tolumonas lignilytica]